MQSSRFSAFPTVHPSFQRHRKSIDHSRFTLNLSLCSTKYSPIWASLPTPPMSGSPPPDPPRDPSQLAGRRRKRSDTPPTTTAAVSTSALPALVEYATPRYGEHLQDRRHEEAMMQLAPQPVPYLPPLTYGAGPGAPLTQYAPPELPPSQQQISPRATRKTKAHVASACINCKKKHLRCDNSRPCRRCVQSGKEDTCRDVEHKKRGRPPLKPEDPSAIGRRGHGPAHLGHMSDTASMHHGGDLRSYTTSNYPPILPNAPPSMYGHHRGSSRSSAYGGITSPYATPSVASSYLNATAGGFSHSGRPQSTSSTISTQPPSPYPPQPPYAGHGTRMPMPQYGYPFQPVDMPANTQAMYATPLFPRDQGHPPMQAEGQYGHGVQLPPIRPAQATQYDTSALQQRSTTQRPVLPSQIQRQESDERDPKRPKMDIQGILGPKND